MSTGVDIIEPRLDTRSARQVARDTRKHEAMARKRLTSKGATIAALVIAIFWTIPTFGLFVTSFRPGSDVQSTGWWTVFVDPSFTLDNYRAALTSGGTALTLGESFLNSLAITIPVVFFALAIASLLAYAFAWIDFKGRNLAFIAVFALQIVPLQIRAALTSETVLGRENLAGALALGMIVVVGVVMAIYALVQRRAARWQS